MDILEGLNPEQREAVTTTEGFVRVIAGAGSGKTRALARRFAYLVEELGVMPGGILCVTFTNKSAGEMRARIHALTGDNDTGYINTFHGFCVSVLQEESYALQYPKSFLVLDNSDIDAMLEIIYSERGLTLRDMSYADARDMIEIRKLFKEPEYYKDMLAMPLDALKSKYDAASGAGDVIFYGYLYQEKKCFALDYNDLIKFTLHIFRERGDIRLKWQSRLEYIMIDEFQDIDSLQYELMQVLCGYHGNLFVVGDPDQCIYTWRGADVKYLLDFDKAFPGAKTIMMTRNYRSTPQIIGAANSLISRNKTRADKSLLPTRPAGAAVRACFGENREEEARWIAARVEEEHARGAPYRDMAVLYRAHYVSRCVEEAFIAAKLPYAIYSGTAFFNRAEIKDALSYLRMVASRDDLSFRRIVNRPRRNIGRRRMEFLERYAAERSCTLFDALRANLDEDMFKGTGARRFVSLIEDSAAVIEGRSVSEALAAILDESGYERMLRTEGAQERLDNLAELKQSVRAYEDSCGEELTVELYLRHAALLTNADTAGDGDRVKLMTVHAAKGLEFPHVFLCGMNEGIFPTRRVRTLPAMEEERRLAFVAMTRAMDSLAVSGAAGRDFDGAPLYPSRFVLEIAPGELSWDTPLRDSLVREANAAIGRADARLAAAAAGGALPEGTRVRHFAFGEGTVVAEDAGKGAHVIKFDAAATPRSISWRVKLERI